MKKIYLNLFGLILGVFLLGNNAWAQPDYMYTVSPYVDSVWVVDTSSWSVDLPGMPVTDTTTGTSAVTGFNGMAVNPCTGMYYVIYKTGDPGERFLGTINMTNGIISRIGGTGESIAGICFVNDTLLVGVTGDGSTTSNILVTIDMNTAALTQVATLGNGSDGENIGYCADDGNIYHWSGRDTNPAMERIDPTTWTVTTVTRSGFNYDEVFGSVYIGDGNFLLANLDQEFIIVDTTGFAVNTGNTTHDYYKGMAFPLRTAWLAGSDSICSNDSTLLSASDGASHQWFVDGTLIPGANTQDYYANVAGWYTCEITINGVMGSCIDSASGFWLTVNPSPDVTMADTIRICQGDSTMLSILADSAVTIQWYHDGNPVFPGAGQTLWVGAPGEYSVAVLNIWGCYDSTAVGTNLIVDMPNVAGFTQSADTVDLAISGDVTFTSTGMGMMIDWEFGDGGTDMGPNPTHTYTTPGTYTVYQVVHGGACPNDTIWSTVVVINSTGIDAVSRYGAQLYQNAPNPFTNFTTIAFELNTPAQVTLKVYNILGAEVKTLYNGSATAGKHTVNWDARDNDGNALGAGSYIYQLTVDGVMASETMMIVK